jgi:uncharacterized protein with PIN domain
VGTEDEVAVWSPAEKPEVWTEAEVAEVRARATKLHDALRAEAEAIDALYAEKAGGAVSEFTGRVKTHPSTLHMDGTSPVVVYVRATTDELRELHGKTVCLVVEPAEKPDSVK